MVKKAFIYIGFLDFSMWNKSLKKWNKWNKVHRIRALKGWNKGEPFAPSLFHFGSVLFHFGRVLFHFSEHKKSPERVTSQGCMFIHF